MAVRVNIRLTLTLSDSAVDRLVGPDDGGPVWAAEAREVLGTWARKNPEAWKTFQEGPPEVEVDLG